MHKISEYLVHSPKIGQKSYFFCYLNIVFSFALYESEVRAQSACAKHPLLLQSYTNYSSFCAHLVRGPGSTAARPLRALFFISVFKRYKGSQDTRHTNYYFAYFSNFSGVSGVGRCFLVLFSFSVFFCASPFIELTQKMIQK